MREIVDEESNNVALRESQTLKAERTQKWRKRKLVNFLMEYCI